MALERVGVHLADHQGHVVVHAPTGGVVDHGGACLHEARRPLAGGRPAGREKRQVEALDRLLAQALHHQFVVAALRLQGPAHRAFRGERHDLPSREVAPQKELEHKRADLTGGSHHGDPVALGAHRPRLALGRRLSMA